MLIVASAVGSGHDPIRPRVYTAWRFHPIPGTGGFTRSTAEFHFPHMSIVPVYTRIGAISWAGS